MTTRLFGLVEKLVELQQQADALGIFMDDRELLDCDGCGLHEDITAQGKLITSMEGHLGQDSGLRFDELGDHAFRCPQCGEILLISDADSVSEIYSYDPCKEKLTNMASNVFN